MTYLLLVALCPILTTSAPATITTQTRDTLKLSNKIGQFDHLVYAEFHSDQRIINLAIDLLSPTPGKFYLRECKEKQYHDWYLNEFPKDCQIRFANAGSLEDLLNVYCDHKCGANYLMYIEACGETAKYMADSYRRLCWERKTKM